MILTMFINRSEDWFYFSDLNLDPFYFAIIILKKLSSRPKIGLKYNRIELIKSLINKKSEDGLKVLDMAILLLSSRNLISIDKSTDSECALFITEAGLKLLDQYKGELKICKC